MMRWTVDIGDVNIEADLQRENTRTALLALAKLAPPPPAGTAAATSAAPAGAAAGKVAAVPLLAAGRGHTDGGMGEVWVLDASELVDRQEEQLILAPDISGPFSTNANANNSNFPAGGALGATVMGDRAIGLQSLMQSQSALFSGGDGSGGGDGSPRAKEIKVYSTFVTAQETRTAVTITMTRPNFRGVDIVNAFLMQAVASDEWLCARYSTNPRLYKLFIADEDSGEEEMVVQLDLKAQNFPCYAVNPLPAAKLYLFPQRDALLPTTPFDIKLKITIRANDPQSKPILRECAVPADMLAESVEETLRRRLPASAIVPGSLRLKYGPLELNINEYYNFGPGCGSLNCPIAERTMLSLYRYGINEVAVSGRAVEVAHEAGLLSQVSEDIDIDMDVEEALSFQQFEVISITRYGARQQRVLCVDGEHLYTMRPNSDAASNTNTTERPIKEIDEVRTFPDKPKYMEIAYTKESKYEEDRFECTTTYNRALLDEKLRIVRRELRKREAELEKPSAEKNMVHRLFGGFASRWFRDKGN